MSNLKHAHLGFGFPLLTEDGESAFSLDTSRFKDTDTFIASCFGLNSPNLPYEENKVVYEQYWKKRSDLLRHVGVSFWDHDVDDRSKVPIVVVSESVRIASNGHNPNVLGVALNPRSEWRWLLQEFCLKTGIPYQEPHFVLFVSWDH